MKDKKEIFEDCLAELNSRYLKLEQIFISLTAAAESESKSTAGDKHETGRAMIQIEQEKIAKQMKDVEDLKIQLQKIDLSYSEKIKTGSVVITDRGTFFISVALGRVNEVIGISPLSPVGRKIMGLKAGNKAEVNGNLFQIVEVF